MLTNVVGLLADHLSVGDLVRLKRALGPNTEYPRDVEALLTSRIGLKRHQSIEQISARIRTGSRCVECGILTRRRPRVCDVCAKDPSTPVCMDTRRTVLERYKGRKGIRRIVTSELRIVKRGRTGCLYYWRSEVETHLAQSANGQMTLKPFGNDGISK